MPFPTDAWGYESRLPSEPIPRPGPSNRQSEPQVAIRSRDERATGGKTLLVGAVRVPTGAAWLDLRWGNVASQSFPPFGQLMSPDSHSPLGFERFQSCVVTSQSWSVIRLACRHRQAIFMKYALQGTMSLYARAPITIGRQRYLHRGIVEQSGSQIHQILLPLPAYCCVSFICTAPEGREIVVSPTPTEL